MIIFIGDKPSARMAKDARPFEGAACEQRLYDWIFEIIPESVREHTIINQCDYSYANFYAMHLRDKHILIALGNNASKALKNIPHYKLPHPSGKNRLLNNKKFVAKKLKACKNYIKKNS